MRVAVRGGRLHVEVSGDGPAILLIHGWPLDHRVFAPQVDALAGHFTVIAYDRRGFGRSEAPPDLRHELDDIDRILNALGIEAVHLLGMSQGGRIALRYAATHPGRLRSLILQGAVVDGLEVEEREEDRVPVADYAELARAGKLSEVIDSWLNHPMMRLGDRHEKERALLRRILKEYTGADLKNFRPESYAFGPDILEAMAAFPRPTLLLTGARETPARRRHAGELLRRIPDCREVVFDQSGHLSNLTEPDAYNNALLEFCQRVEGGES